MTSDGFCIAVEVNNTLIYLISRPLLPPADPLTTASPELELSSFLLAVFSASLADRLKQEPRTTFLIPENDGFKRLGTLVSAHLLSASSKADLERVVLHHVLSGVEYSTSLQNGTQISYPTLEGSDVRIVERTSNATSSSIIISASGGWSGMNAEITTKNMLTNTGVVHELSDLLLPRTLNITVGKLVKAAKGSTMATMLARAGMDWVLNGTAPPDGSPWADEGMQGAGWTLLCPTEEAFKGIDLTELYEDSEFLKAVVGQHLIPVPTSSPLLADTPNGKFDPAQTNKPLLLDDSASYTTLQSRSSAYGDIVFRDAGLDGSPTGYLVGIKDARGTAGQRDWARVLGWGRTTTSSRTGGVIQIDALLVPYRPPWWRAMGAPLAVGALGVFGIALFFAGVRKFWKRDTTEATYEPVGGFSQVDDED